MGSYLKKLVLLFIILKISNKALGKINLEIPTDCKQIVLVTTTGWKEFRGELIRLERDDNNRWVKCAQPIKVVLGKNGMAWDIAQKIYIEKSDSSREYSGTKKEGDNKTPAGIFRILSIFSNDKKCDNTAYDLSFMRITSNHVAVDDPESIYYNQIIDTSDIDIKDWSSYENMNEIDLYNLGIAIDYNTKNIHDAGSCIFIHRWRSENKPTAGCVAMKYEDLHDLCKWLKKNDKPILIVLPLNKVNLIKELGIN